MKKWILLLSISLILTGCSSKDYLVEARPSTNEIQLDFSQEEGIYVNDEMQSLIKIINDLSDKYGKNAEGGYYRPLYEDIYTDAIGYRDRNFDNNHVYGLEYFNELVQILDETIAEGLEDYVTEMKNKELKTDEVIAKKIGRTTIIVQNRGGKEGNYISISIHGIDIKDEYYRDLFNEIAMEEYILDDFIIGEKLNLMDFRNENNSRYGYSYENPDIRYNIYFQDRDIEKVNILIQKKNQLEFGNEDINVFINMINSLELKENEKDLLMEEYKNLLGRKVSNKKMDLENYKLLINGTKGSPYSGRDKSLIYFSIEKNK